MFEPAPILTKHPGSTRTYDFDFSDWPEIVAGATISNATVAISACAGEDADVTAGTPTAAGGLVQFTLTGGQDQGEYDVTVTATLNTSAIIVGVARLNVQDGEC